MKSFLATGIILKRMDIGEADRMVTVFTKEHGKMVAVAKGCRKLTSSKLSALEPATLSKCYFISTNNAPLLTQAQLLQDFAGAKKDLPSMRKIFEVLEMVDMLLMDEDEQPEVFDRTHAILDHLNTEEKTNPLFVRTHLISIIQTLGFAHFDEIDLSRPIKDFVEELTQRKLHSYAFLSSL